MWIAQWRLVQVANIPVGLTSYDPAQGPNFAASKEVILPLTATMVEIIVIGQTMRSQRLYRICNAG